MTRMGSSVFLGLFDTHLHLAKMGPLILVHQFVNSIDLPTGICPTRRALSTTDYSCWAIPTESLLHRRRVLTVLRSNCKIGLQRTTEGLIQREEESRSNFNAPCISHGRRRRHRSSSKLSSRIFVRILPVNFAYHVMRRYFVGLARDPRVRQLDSD